jgi:hypothetical protein
MKMDVVHGRDLPSELRLEEIRDVVVVRIE